MRAALVLWLLLAAPGQESAPLQASEKPHSRATLEVAFADARGAEIEPPHFQTGPDPRTRLNADHHLVAAPARQGRVLFWSDVRPGSYDLLFGGPDREILLAATVKSSTLTRLKVTLAADVAVRGRILDTRGAGVAGVPVSAAWSFVTPTRETLAVRSSARTDASGAYRLAAGPAASSRVVVDGGSVVAAGARRYLVRGDVWTGGAQDAGKGEVAAADFTLHELSARARVELGGFQKVPEVFAYVKARLPGSWLLPAGEESWIRIGESGEGAISSLPLGAEVLFAAKVEGPEAPVLAAARLEREMTGVPIQAAPRGGSLRVRFQGTETAWTVKEVRIARAVLVVPEAYAGLDDPRLAVEARPDGTCDVTGIGGGPVVARPLAWIATALPADGSREDLRAIHRLLQQKLRRQSFVPDERKLESVAGEAAATEFLIKEAR